MSQKVASVILEGSDSKSESFLSCCISISNLAVSALDDIHVLDEAPRHKSNVTAFASMFGGGFILKLVLSLVTWITSACTKVDWCCVRRGLGQGKAALHQR